MIFIKHKKIKAKVFTIEEILNLITKISGEKGFVGFREIVFKVNEFPYIEYIVDLDAGNS